MKWKKPSWNLFKVFNKESSKPDLTEEIQKSGVCEYTFSISVKENDSLLRRKIKMIIVQNPWSILTKKPSITNSQTESGDSVLKISFQTHSKVKGKLIEEDIRRQLNSD